MARHVYERARHAVDDSEEAWNEDLAKLPWIKENRARIHAMRTDFRAFHNEAADGWTFPPASILRRRGPSTGNPVRRWS